jgi:hypothetical protein
MAYELNEQRTIQAKYKKISPTLIIALHNLYCIYTCSPTKLPHLYHNQLTCIISKSFNFAIHIYKKKLLLPREKLVLNSCKNASDKVLKI